MDLSYRVIFINSFDIPWFVSGLWYKKGTYFQKLQFQLCNVVIGIHFLEHNYFFFLWFVFLNRRHDYDVIKVKQRRSQKCQINLIYCCIHILHLLICGFQFKIYHCTFVCRIAGKWTRTFRCIPVLANKRWYQERERNFKVPPRKAKSCKPNLNIPDTFLHQSYRSE